MKTEMNVYIDGLIIEGLELSPGQQRQLKTGVETALKNLFTGQGIPPGIASMNSLGRMPDEAIKLTGPDIQPAQLGEKIAHSIYQGLNKQV